MLSNSNELSMSGDLEDHYISPMYGSPFEVHGVDHKLSRSLGSELPHLCDKPLALLVSILHLKCVLSETFGVIFPFKIF